MPRQIVGPGGDIITVDDQIDQTLAQPKPTLRTLAPQPAEEQPKKKSLLRRIGGALTAPVVLGRAAGTTLDKDNNIVPFQTQTSYPRLAALWADPKVAQMQAEAAAEAGSARTLATMQQQKMELEHARAIQMKAPKVFVSEQFGVLEANPETGEIKQVLKPSDLQDTGKIVSYISTGLSQIEDPTIRSSATNDVMGLIGAGQFKQAETLYNSYKAKDITLSSKTNRGWTRDPSSTTGYAQVTLDSHGNELSRTPNLQPPLWVTGRISEREVAIPQPDGSIAVQTLTTKTQPLGSQSAGGKAAPTTVHGTSDVHGPRIVGGKIPTMLAAQFKTYEDAVSRFNLMDEIGKHAATDKSGASDAVLLALHMGMSVGSVKGMRVGKDIIGMHAAALSFLDSIGVKFEKIAGGKLLSPSQRTEYIGLAKERLVQEERQYGATRDMYEQAGKGGTLPRHLGAATATGNKEINFADLPR